MNSWNIKHNSILHFEKVTVSDNLSIDNNSSIFIKSSNLLVTNSIVWPDIILFELEQETDINYSCINGFEGIGNINLNPLFKNPENDDYSLQILSPAIDSGDPNSLIDLDGTIITQISDQSIDTSMIQILGEKANENLESLIKSINIHFPELLNDIKSLEYIELRRWNMKLRRDLKIKFPDEKIDQSIINLKRLFVEQNVSESNIIEIDLRIHGRASVKVLEGKVKFGVDEI